MNDSNSICFEISAPGKVILHGEHSVVYGKTVSMIFLNKMLTEGSIFEKKTTGRLIIESTVYVNFMF